MTLNKHFFSTSLIKANLLSRSPNNNLFQIKPPQAPSGQGTPIPIGPQWEWCLQHIPRDISNSNFLASSPFSISISQLLKFILSFNLKALEKVCCRKCLSLGQTYLLKAGRRWGAGVCRTEARSTAHPRSPRRTVGTLGHARSRTRVSDPAVLQHSARTSYPYNEPDSNFKIEFRITKRYQ